MSKFKQILLTIWILIWSIPLNIFAAIVVLGLLIIGAKPLKWGPAIRFEKGKHWGGLEMGLCFFMTDDTPSYHTKCHETGHLLQQAIFGPIMPFVVSLPSASRYWLYQFNTQRARYIYCVLLALALLVITLIPITLGAIFSIWWLFIIGVLLTAYVIILCSWLTFIETPKFASDETRPEYNNFWAEADASRRGEAFMKKYYPDVK